MDRTAKNKRIHKPYISKERSDLVLWNSTVFGIVQLASVLITYPYGIYTMVCAFSGINLLWLFVWFHFVRREIGLRLREAFLDLFPYAALAALAMAGAAFITSPVENTYLLLTSKIATAALLYTGLMWLCGSATFKECLGFILRKGQP